MTHLNQRPIYTTTHQSTKLGLVWFRGISGGRNGIPIHPLCADSSKWSQRFWVQYTHLSRTQKDNTLMEKPHVLVTVLCGTERANWINPRLNIALVIMSHDTRFRVETRYCVDAKPIDYAR